MAFKGFTTGTIEVTDGTAEGLGVTRFEDKVIFLPDAIPGDGGQVEVIKKRRRFFQGRWADRSRPSPQRVAPACVHFGACGGCKWQHMSYEGQLHMKQNWVQQQLQRISGVELPAVQPILGAPQAFRYRNKLEFSFSNTRWWLSDDPEDAPQNVLGLHPPRYWDKVVDIDACHLGTEWMDTLRNFVRGFAREQGYTFWDARTQQGQLRQLLLRYAQATASYMVVLILGEDDEQLAKDIFEAYRQAHPAVAAQVASWQWLYNPKPNDSYADLEPRLLGGQPYLEEHLGALRYRIGPTSFFQTNTQQARQLYELVRQLLPAQVHTLYDLYCGAATIGLYVADKARKVIGIEYVEAAVADGRVNCELNGVSHIELFAGDMAKLLTQAFCAEHGKPEVIITDPPRGGMHPDVLAQLLALGAPTIIYVSCNPASQARDLKLLAEKYEVDFIQPVDMFPQTSHVECVMRLRLRASR